MGNVKADDKLDAQVDILVSEAIADVNNMITREYRIGCAFNQIRANTNKSKLEVSNRVSEKFKAQDHESAKSFYNAGRSNGWAIWQRFLWTLKLESTKTRTEKLL
jgi:hypothetical protein